MRRKRESRFLGRLSWFYIYLLLLLTAAWLGWRGWLCGLGWSCNCLCWCLVHIFVYV